MISTFYSYIKKFSYIIIQIHSSHTSQSSKKENRWDFQYGAVQPLDEARERKHTKQTIFVENSTNFPRVD